MTVATVLRLFVFLFFVIVSSHSEVGAVEEVKIASTGPGLSTLPLEIAARRSFFRDEGLDVLNITMRANITAYSTAVGPSSKTRNRRIFLVKLLIRMLLFQRCP